MGKKAVKEAIKETVETVKKEAGEAKVANEKAKKEIKTRIVYKDKIFDIAMNEGDKGAFVRD